MFLKSLKTKNFKKLGTREFSFTSGLNFILGDNGAGKSTLTRAIATALYGVSALPGIADDVATWGTNSWAVELEFEKDGEVYLVRRTKSSASVEKDGQQIASGNTPVTKEMEDLLGLDIKDYYLFLHSRQGETAYILRYGATALQRKVEEFSGVSLIDELQKLANRKSTEVKAVAEGYRTLDSEVLEEIEDKISSLELRLQEKYPEPKKPEIDLTALRNSYRAYMSYRAELAEYRSQKDSLTEQLEALVEVKQPEPVEGLADKIKQLREQKREFDRWEADKKSLNEQLIGLEIPVEPSLERCNNLEELIETNKKLQEEIFTVNRSIEEAQTAVDTGICSSCGTILSDSLEDHELKLVSLRQFKKEAEEEYEERQQIICHAQSVEREFDAFIRKSEEYSKNKADLLKRIDNLIEVDPIDESHLEDLLLQQRNYTDDEEAYETYSQRKSRLESRLAALSCPDEVQEVDEDTVKAAESENSKYLSELSLYKEHQTRIEVWTAEVSRLQKDLKQDAENLNAKAENLKLSERYSELAKYLSKRRNDYLKQVWDNIILRASELLKYMTEDWLTGISIVDSKFLYEENGHWISTMEASGAQAAFIGAALRLSMNRILYGSDSYLVFDEPTADMTEENSRALVSGIAESASQVLIVTHRTGDQNLAENVVEV